MNKALLTKDLIRDEGQVLHAYQDHLGYWTLGVGRLIDKRKGGGISEEEARYLLANDIQRHYAELMNAIPWMEKLSEGRQRALTNMAFQMGIQGLLGFKNTLALLRDGRYYDAAENAKKSLWYKQTPERAQRVIDLLVKG